MGNKVEYGIDLNAADYIKNMGEVIKQAKTFDQLMVKIKKQIKGYTKAQVESGQNFSKVQVEQVKLLAQLERLQVQRNSTIKGITKEIIKLKAETQANNKATKEAVKLENAQANTLGKLKLETKKLSSERENLKLGSPALKENTKLLRENKKEIKIANLELDKKIKVNKDLSVVQEEQAKLLKQHTNLEARKNVTTKAIAKEVTKLKVESQALNKTTKDGIKQDQAAEGSIDKLRITTRNLTNVRNKLNLNTKEGIAEYKKLNTIILRNNTILNSSNKAIGNNTADVGKYHLALKGAGKALKGFGQLAGITSGIYLLQSALRSSVTILKEISDSFAGAQKTTGLTYEQIGKLNDQLKKLDTRTAQGALLDIVKAAGRMNVAEKDILKFTETVDKVFVSLGDELSGSAEDIAIQLAKIASQFGLEKEFGIAGGIERIGSVVNFLGNTSKAQAQPILDFTTAVQGLGGALNLPVEKVLALGATFSELGNQVEVDATSITHLLLKLVTNTQELADIAGI